MILNKSKKSDKDAKSNTKSFAAKYYEDKYINIDIFIRVCLNEYTEKKILQMERLLAVLKIKQYKNYWELLYNDFKDAIKSTWNEKSKNGSDSMTFSLNKINHSFCYVTNELKDPIYTEDEVILKLVPFLNWSMETRAFSLKYKCKNQVKELLDREVIDAYTEKDQDPKRVNPFISSKKSPKGIMPQGINKSNLKESLTKSAISLPKSIIPSPKEFSDTVSSEILQEELTKQYQTTSSHLKDYFTTSM